MAEQGGLFDRLTDRLILRYWGTPFARALIWATCRCRNNLLSATADGRGIYRCDACGRRVRERNRP